MGNMDAYLDDFGRITVWIKKNFYNGMSNRFILSAGSDYIKELIINSVENHTNNTKYELIAPADLEFGTEYYIREEHGLRTALEFRMIVRTRRFDEMFTYTGNDLGSRYSRFHTDFALWAPTAVNVILKIENNGSVRAYEMRREEHGVWRMRVNGDLKSALYTYLIRRSGTVIETIDPYAYSSSANGEKSAVIDLNQILSIDSYKLNDEVISPTDAVIYECSVRDMTSNPLTGTHERGTFGALTQDRTTYKEMPTGLSYLHNLGVTHVQIMPVQDFATVEEHQPDLYYNWGYDPMQFLTLEGSYSSDPDDPYSRMKEMRKMVGAMHKRDLRVVLDVVYNHLYNLETSALHATVPQYYFRYNESGFLSNGSFCGNDIDSTKPMMQKLLLHTIKEMIRIYDVDGFRFDLMGLLDVDTMNLIAQTARKMKPGVLIYGEGWNMPTMLDDAKKACMDNQGKMPGIGHFNDYFRDILKGKTNDGQKYEKGYITGDLGFAYSALSALGGNAIGDPYYRRFDSPDKSINAMETHDNATVWDKMHACCGNEDRATRLKRQKMIIACVFVSQGVPFLHAGQEFCGTKNDNSNSYNAGDAINQMNWERAILNRDVIEYTRKCISLRKKHAGFRLKTSQEIEKSVKFTIADFNVIFYDINYEDQKGKPVSLRVMLNPSYDSHYYHFDEAWQVIFDENGNKRDDYGWDFNIPGLAIWVLKKKNN
ncbi:MAG: type I pullulanase [Solobacterium sp.]|nr:type I pullulanase [Solobacterium sp.]